MSTWGRKCDASCGNIKSAFGTKRTFAHLELYGVHWNRGPQSRSLFEPISDSTFGQIATSRSEHVGIILFDLRLGCLRTR